MSTPLLVSQIDIDVTPQEAAAQAILDEIIAAPKDVQAIILNRILSSLVKQSESQANQTFAGAAQPKGATKPARGAAKKSPAKIYYESQLKAHLEEPLDPFEAWDKLGGAAGLEEILPQEQIGLLEAMYRNPLLPPGAAPRGKTNNAYAKAIIARLKIYYGVK